MLGVGMKKFVFLESLYSAPAVAEIRIVRGRELYERGSRIEVQRILLGNRVYLVFKKCGVKQN